MRIKKLEIAVFFVYAIFDAFDPHSQRRWLYMHGLTQFFVSIAIQIDMFQK